MKKFFTNFTSQLNKGFTLIELLIVIAILGILAVATLAVLDPIDKINAGNDSKVQSDIANIAKAAEAYAVQNNGSYPANLDAMVTSGDLRSKPTAPSGYTAYTYSVASNVFTISGQLKSKKYTSTNTDIFKYRSSEGKACAVSAVGNNCP